MWDCYSLEVLKLEGSLCSQTLQGSVDFPILAKGNEGCSTPTPGGQSPLMITQSFDLCPKSVLLLDQWHQGTDTWPECWCCVSSSTQDIAIPFWTWGRPGDGSEMSPERVWRGNAVPDSIKVHKGDQKWGSLPFPSLPFSSGHRAHLTCTQSRTMEFHSQVSSYKELRTAHLKKKSTYCTIKVKIHSKLPNTIIWLHLQSGLEPNQSQNAWVSPQQGRSLFLGFFFLLLIGSGEQFRLFFGNQHSASYFQ